jgi:hypothetical protein
LLVNRRVWVFDKIGGIKISLYHKQKGEKPKPFSFLFDKPVGLFIEFAKSCDEVNNAV